MTHTYRVSVTSHDLNRNSSLLTPTILCSIFDKLFKESSMSTSTPSSTSIPDPSSFGKPPASLYVFTFVTTGAIILAVCSGLSVRTYLYRSRLRSHLLSLNISEADRVEIRRANGSQLHAISRLFEDMGITSRYASGRPFLGSSNTPYVSNQRRRTKSNEVVLASVPELWETTIEEDRPDSKYDAGVFEWKDIHPVSSFISAERNKLSSERTLSALVSTQMLPMLQNSFPVYPTSGATGSLLCTVIPPNIPPSASSVLDQIVTDQNSHVVYVSVLIKMPEDSQLVSARVKEQETEPFQDRRGFCEMGNIELGIAMIQPG